jgi:exonuclease SbcC
MRINKIILENFKTYKSQTFDIQGKNLILLTGSNGFGKTTIIDSIEWCLTGDIKRLKNSYEERNTTQTEKIRLENNKGIIKFSGSKPEDKIKVALYIEINNTVVKVSREQDEDSLYAKSILKFEDDTPKEFEEVIAEYVGEGKFYNYHVCDTHKVYNFLNDNRQDIKKQFDNFIRQYPVANNVSKKLTELIEGLKQREREYGDKKISEELIEKQKQDISLLKDSLKILDYPQIKLFDDDETQIEGKHSEELLEQLSRIQNYAYNAVSKKTRMMIEYRRSEEQLNKLTELSSFIENDNQNLLSSTIRNSFYKLDRLDDLKKNIKELKTEKKNLESITTLEDLKGAFASGVYANLIITLNTEIRDITEFNETLKGINSEISEKEKGNEIIAALSNLVVGRESIFNYKNEGNEKCPLCGSNEYFDKITSYEELAYEANHYIKKSETDLLTKKQEKERLLKIFDRKFTELKEKFLRFLMIEIEDKTILETSYLSQYNQTKEFFEKLSAVGIFIDFKLFSNVKREKKSKEDFIINSKTLFEESLSQVKDILLTLNLKIEPEPWSLSILEKINLESKSLISKELDVINFDFDVFNKKKLFIENVLNNNKLAELEAKLNEGISLNKELSDKIEKNAISKNKAELLRDEIERKKTNIEKVELQEVGNYLYKIFTKVIKHTKISEFKLNRDAARITSGGATFLDQNGNNIHNIMSQGQLGVFILSYFFANMFKRKDETNFKTYFIDDITSSMDDMNVLSFVDIIKYQLSKQAGVIDQIFFSTCDSDLEKLLIHKMKSFSIDWINIKFTSYAKGIVTDDYEQVTF